MKRPKKPLNCWIATITADMKGADVAMTAIMNKKMESRKLLAAFAVLALVVCAFAAVQLSEESTAAPATNVPEAIDGTITITESGLELNGDATITDRLVLNGTLTVPKGYTLTINYAFTASGQHVIDFGTNGKIVVAEGATLNINASNGTVDSEAYVPANNAGNSVFAGATTTGYTSTGDDAAIQVNGTMNVNVDAAVKGNTNQSERTIYVTGTFNSDSNGYATTYFLVNGGTVDINLKDGSVTGYVNVTGEGASFDIGGTNTTGNTISDAVYKDGILNLFGMRIGTGASATIDGKAQIYNRSVTAPTGLTISTIINSGSVAITENGQLAVPENTTFNGTNGTTVVDGTLNLNGNFTGSISGSGNMTGEPDSYPVMPDNYIYNAPSGYSYVVQHYEYNKTNGTKVLYQFGLATNTITYDGTPVWIDELSVIPISLQTAANLELKFTNTSSTWYDPVENDTYTGWLRDATESGNAGTYNRVVQFDCSLTSNDGNLIGSSVTKIIGLTVQPGRLNVDVSMEGWMEGEPVNSPSTVVTTTAGVELAEGVDYIVSYAYYTDRDCTRPITGTLEDLTADTYYVKATVTPQTQNFTEGTDSTDFIVEVYVIDSEVSFHALQELNDNELEKSILGVNPDDIQKNINFDEINNAIAQNNVVSGKITGTLLNITNSDSIWNTLSSKFTGTSITDTSGYFLAFYVQSDVEDITLADVLASNITMVTDPNANLIVDITPVDNATDYRFYVMYIADLQADDLDSSDPQAEVDTLGYTVDFDGSTGTAGQDGYDTYKYDAMTYEIDLSYLNMYIIILHDYIAAEDENGENVYQNFTLTDYRIDGARYTLINGAGDGFVHWATEDGSAFPSYSFGSVMVVGVEFDPDRNGIINLYATYGDSTGQDTPDEPVTTGDIAVSIYKDTENGYVVVALSAVTGGAIPAGDISVTYTCMVANPLGIYDTVTKTIPVSVEEGTTSIVLDPEDFEGNLGTTIAISASFPVDGTTYTSNPMSFSIMLATMN